MEKIEVSRIYDALKLTESGQSAALAQLIDDEHVHASVQPYEPYAESDAGGAHDFEFVDQGGFEEPHGIAAAESPVAFKSWSPAVALSVPPGMPVFPFETEPRASEQYRILRTNLVQHELKPKVIAVSSAAPGDGKTISAVNLAGILALTGDVEVLLIDADLRSCSVGAALGLSGTPGLSEVLSGDCAPDQAIIAVAQLPGLYVLSSGNVKGNPAELLDSEAFRSLVAEARSRFSFVVLDTPPMTAVTDYKLVQEICDGVLVVVRPDHTNRAVFVDAMKTQQKEKLLGTVINAVDDWFLWRSREAYNYHAPAVTGKPSFWHKWTTRAPGSN